MTMREPSGAGAALGRNGGRGARLADPDQVGKLALKGIPPGLLGAAGGKLGRDFLEAVLELLQGYRLA